MNNFWFLSIIPFRLFFIIIEFYLIFVLIRVIPKHKCSGFVSPELLFS